MKLASQITAIIVLVTAISGVAYKGFTLDQRIQQNSQAITLFTIDKLERLIQSLLEKRERQGGRLTPKDSVMLDRYQKQLDIEYRKLGK